MRRLGLLIGWLTVALLAAGCPAAPFLLLAGAGGVAGYAVSKDKVELMVEQPYAKVWGVALEETKRAGLLKDLHEDTGRIEATYQGTHIVVTLERVTETSVKVVVKARKHLLPKIDVAQRLATRMARRLG
ncbi:MAG: hypothetical protein HY600_05255 [Candidatus Omnitrophica bacterium]|nr:hypothetical protein [Candidatus Omnitrophota bacterium]